MRRICIVTGTRAEYGLLRWVMQGIQESPCLELQVIATGAHLESKFGLTYRDIEDDGFRIDRKVSLHLDSDTAIGVTRSMGSGLSGFAEALAEMKPDIVMLLGDRYELLMAACAATIARIPIAHLHGGEATEGAFDEAIRHAITKMSHLHFVAAEPYRRRVVQMGEAPKRVFNVGGLGVDSLARLELMDKLELERSLDFCFGKRNLLVTFHPATLEPGATAQQMAELLSALDDLQDTHLIFTMPNADTENKALFDMIEAFVLAHRHTAKAFVSLGNRRYLSCITQVDGVVGNSSSGLLEVPSFKKGTVNIGDRQKGRIKAPSVVDCKPERSSILAAIARLYDADFQAGLAEVENPYGKGGASQKIVERLEKTDVSELLRKRFYDLPEDAIMGGCT